MKKVYRIPQIRMVQLCDRICLVVGSQDADPEQAAGAKKSLWDEEEDYYEE